MKINTIQKFKYKKIRLASVKVSLFSGFFHVILHLLHLDLRWTRTNYSIRVSARGHYGLKLGNTVTKSNTNYCKMFGFYTGFAYNNIKLQSLTIYFFFLCCNTIIIIVRWVDSNELCCQVCIADWFSKYVERFLKFWKAF